MNEKEVEGPRVWVGHSGELDYSHSWQTSIYIGVSGIYVARLEAPMGTRARVGRTAAQPKTWVKDCLSSI